METVKWYKYGVFWRRGDGDDNHGPTDHDDGWIDFLTNALSKYREEQDFTRDAIECFKQSAILLVQHKRFPDELHSSEEVKFWWMYYIRLPLRWIRKKMGLKLKPMRRSQFDMTRDPYKAFGSLYAFLYRYNTDSSTREVLTTYFNMVSIPLRLRRGGIQRWWNRFKKDNRKQFVQRMGSWVALGIHDWYEANYSDDFYKDKTP